MAANPWGLDESKYFVSVGGLSSFLDLADSHLPKKPLPPQEFTNDLAKVLDLQA